MNKFHIASHPVSMIPYWREKLDGNWLASFSRYRYESQLIEDKRERFTVPLHDVTPRWLEKQLEGLEASYELAIESRLLLGRQERHIPMIDFAVDAIQSKEVLAWAQKHLGLNLKLFDSGRSFHAYGLEPISRSRWVKLMGLLLLANIPGKTPLIDTRWVGHRLLAGYSALRWSCNSPRYLRFPTVINT